MNRFEMVRRLCSLEAEINKFRTEVEHDQSWQEALDRMFGSTEEQEACAPYGGSPCTPAEGNPGTTDKPFTMRSLDPEAAFVEQLEISLSDQGTYQVRLRFDNDETETMGLFHSHSNAYDFAREQATRYHTAIFDSTYEGVVD
jgi:hypothetical protein